MIAKVGGVSQQAVYGVVKSVNLLLMYFYVLKNKGDLK